MALKRMDNVLIVVEDLEAVKAFFIALGLKLEGETMVEGPMVGRLIGLENVRATLAMLRSPDGHCGVELDKFHTPDPVRFGPVDAPVNALGLRRIMFAVEGIDAVVARMRAHGAELIGEMRYGDAYRLAYIRGPEGLIVGLAEEIGKAAPRARKAAARPKAISRAKPAAAGRKKTARMEAKGGKGRKGRKGAKGDRGGTGKGGKGGGAKKKRKA
jgi:catechol 2,3-dioxygenase-like lactoylglutathione lyase family enzyme